MSNVIYHTISTLAYYADMRTREDLVSGSIVDERDYVSNLTSKIRDAYSRVGLSCFSHAQTLPNAVSQCVGCDALIVCNMGSKSKICLFEAKWPRLTESSSRPWDSIREMLLKVLYCRAGDKLDVERDGYLRLPAFDREEIVRIPAGPEKLNEDEVSRFCRDYGIGHFLSIMVKP